MTRDLSRETAEHLLSGASASPRASTDPLAALLAAAAAPAAPRELAREQEALAAFRAVSAGKPRSSLRRAAALKIAAVVAGLLAAAGGAAVAASSAGILPNPFQAPARPPASASPLPTDAGQITPSPSGASATPAAKEMPSNSLSGLCQALAAKPAKDRGKALAGPAFKALVAAAGKPQDVEGYCAGLHATPKPRQTGQPAKSHKPPSAHPARAR